MAGKQTTNPITPLELGAGQVVITPEMAKAMLSRGAGCAWKGCDAICKNLENGRLPPGWRWIAVFTDKPLDGEVDGLLCPAHVAKLGESLAVGYRLSVAAAEANRSEN